MNILHFLTNSRYRKIFALLGIASIPAISVMLYTLYQTFDQAYSVERRNVGASYLVEHLADMAGRIHMASVAGAQAVLSNYEDFRREVQDLAGGYVVRFGHGRYASAGGIPFAQLVDSLSLDLQKRTASWRRYSRRRNWRNTSCRPIRMRRCTGARRRKGRAGSTSPPCC